MTKSNPYWAEAKRGFKFPPLEREIKVDVAVIGGGITGVTTAHLLGKAGFRVALLERDQCGQGDTAHTTAHLTYVTDCRLNKLLKSFGREQTQAVWKANNAALQQIREIVRENKIDCDLATVPGYLHAPCRHAGNGVDEGGEVEELQYEARLAEGLGFDATFMESVPVVGRPGICFADQSTFHPLKYLYGLIAAMGQDGVQIFEGSEVTEFERDPHRVKANGHWVHCDYVVIATHVPLLGENNLLSGTLFQSKLSGYSTYAIGGKIPAGGYPAGCFWDTGTPYDFLRIDQRGGEHYAIYGGEDHKTGQVAETQQRYDRLRQRFLELIPEVQIDHHWSGQVIETADGLPLIGEIAPRQFVMTGFCGNGITFGTLGAMLACDAAIGRKSEWADLFDVSRKKLRAGWDYVKENLDYPYYMLKDWMGPAESGGLAHLGRGEGKVLKINGERAACYRDEHGKVTACSAVCTHMGCLVHWNGAEGTWDCPCHGSRFGTDGSIIAGPAETPLEKVNVKQVEEVRKDPVHT